MGEYFSKDLYDLIMGKISASDFRKAWGENVTHDKWDATIAVGNNTIITNQEDNMDYEDEDDD